MAHPSFATREHGSKCPVISSGISPVDTLNYVLVSKGMAKRLGEAVQSPATLRHEHVEGFMWLRTAQWIDNMTPLARYFTIATILVELYCWLGWLCGQELFGLERADVQVVPPAQGAPHDLPDNVGMVLLKLDLATKSDQTRTADVVLAY